MISSATRLSLFSAAALCVSAGLAHADDPKFAHTSDEELADLKKQADKAVWKAGALAGLVLTTGNSRTTTASAGFKASRKSGNNKVQFELGGAYARSSIFLANDANNSGDIDSNEYDRISQTTARALDGKVRYDRFLSDNNALYVSALGLTNEPAGKKFVGGGQAGYSRTAYQSGRHNLVVEAGYDFSYEEPTVGAGFSNHSVRGFAGYESKLTSQSQLDASLEGLFNVNKLETPTGPADRFEDARIHTQLSLTTNLFTDISFRFGFSARYDNVPSLLPGFGVPFDPNDLPEAQKLDTKTEATLIINFL